MLFHYRKVSFVLLAVFAIFASGCGSNNKGKIVGKWKASTLPGMSEEEKSALKMIGEENFAVILEFTADGKMKGTATITIFGKTETKDIMSADYKLGTGDWVYFTNMTPPPKDGTNKSKDKVVISGDSMTIDTEKGDKVVLTRMK